MPKATLLILTLLTLAPVAALAQQACERGPVTITCPDGQIRDATALICTPHPSR